MSENLLILLSDEHNKRMLGVAGHSHVKTPNLDKLASEGVLFENAYCNSPICVPSRAILATGRYNAEIGYWDNADPSKLKIRFFFISKKIHQLRKHPVYCLSFFT